MNQKIILILGSGHLAYRVQKLFRQTSYQVIHKAIEEIYTQNHTDSLIDNLNQYMQSIVMADVAMVYVLDDKDEINLQFIIALMSMYENLPLTASLFNENLILHLVAEHQCLTIINPAKMAAPHFVAALYQSLDRKPSHLAKPNDSQIKKPNDSLIRKLLYAFLALLLVSVAYFHFVEHWSWVNSIYYVAVTASTVGYGDLNVLQSPDHSKIFVVFLIFASTIFTWLIFSFTIDYLIKKRIQYALGRKKYNSKGHVIVCGLGRLGYFIVEELLQKKEKVIIIEQNEDSNHIDHFRHLGAEVYIGDAKLSKVLADVNVKEAKALIAVINNDATNIEIGLNARTFQQDLRIILRIFDQQMAEKIKSYLNIHLTMSASALVDDTFSAVVKNNVHRKA
jgi:hypothetical protein